MDRKTAVEHLRSSNWQVKTGFESAGVDLWQGSICEQIPMFVPLHISYCTVMFYSREKKLYCWLLSSTYNVMF